MAAIAAGTAVGDPVLSDHLNAIQPALGVSAADAATLFALTDNQLTLDNLSLIYRVASLALASKLSISNLLAIAGLLAPTAANPTAAVQPLLANPAATLAFLSQAAVIRQSGITMDALTYILTPPSAAVSWRLVHHNPDDTGEHRVCALCRSIRRHWTARRFHYPHRTH